MPPIPSQVTNVQRLVSLAHANTLAVSNRTLRPLQRNLESNPAVRDEMESLGGFESIVDQVVFTPAAQTALNSLLNVNTSLITSERMGNEYNQIPTVQEERSYLGQITNITTNIATHLDECCDAIKLLLNDLKSQIRTFSN